MIILITASLSSKTKTLFGWRCVNLKEQSLLSFNLVFAMRDFDFWCLMMCRDLFPLEARAQEFLQILHQRLIR